MPTRGIRVRVRRFVRNILRARGSPQAIAFGFAIGVFVGFTPTIGLQMAMAAALATALGASRIPAMLATWFTNYVTAVPVYFFCYKVGIYLLAPFSPGVRDNGKYVKEALARMLDAPSWLERWHHFEHVMRLAMVPLWTGCLVLGVLGGLISYVVVLRMVYGYLRLREARRQHRAKLWAEQRAAKSKAPDCTTPAVRDASTEAADKKDGGEAA